jgi:hypothetical protein
LRDKKEPIAERNFSAEVKVVFKMVYGIPISMRFVRMSWATDLYASNHTQTKAKEIPFKMTHSPVENALHKKYLKKIIFIEGYNENKYLIV